jgi:hypothetical protein
MAHARPTPRIGVRQLDRIWHAPVTAGPDTHRQRATPAPGHHRPHVEHAARPHRPLAQLAPAQAETGPPEPINLPDCLRGSCPISRTPAPDPLGRRGSRPRRSFTPAAHRSATRTSSHRGTADAVMPPGTRATRFITADNDGIIRVAGRRETYPLVPAHADGRSVRASPAIALEGRVESFAPRLRRRVTAATGCGSTLATINATPHAQPAGDSVAVADACIVVCDRSSAACSVGLCPYSVRTTRRARRSRAIVRPCDDATESASEAW